MYQELDWEKLEEKLIPAPWVPQESAPVPEPETPNANDVYTGDQVSNADTLNPGLRGWIVTLSS